MIELKPFGRWTVTIAKHDDHRQRGDGHQGAEQNEQAADDLNHDGGQAEQLSERHADRVQDRNEIVRPARQLGVAVLEEAQTGLLA